MSAFGANDHSAHRVAFRPATPAELSQARHLVAAHWGLPPPAAAEVPSQGAKNATNLVLHWPGQEPLVLRRARKVPPASRAAASARLLHLLHGRGVPVAPPRPTLAGLPGAVDGPGYATLAPFAPGDHPAGGAAEVASLGGALGSLHAALRGIPAEVSAALALPSRLPPRPEAERRWAALSERAAAADDPLARALRPGEKLVEQAFAAWPDPGDGPGQLIHGDLHLHNVLVADGRVTAILDFDGVRPGAPDDDLAFALHRAVRQAVVHEGAAQAPGEVVATRAAAYLGAYHRAGGTAFGGSRALAAWMRAEAVRRLLVLLGLHYEQGDPTWDADLAKHLATLEEATWFEEIPGWPR